MSLYLLSLMGFAPKVAFAAEQGVEEKAKEVIFTLVKGNHLLDLAAKAGALLLAALIVYFITKFLLVRAARVFARRTHTRYDDILVKKGVFTRAALLAPTPLLFWGLELFPELKDALYHAVYAYLAVAVIMVLTTLVDGLVGVYQTFEVATRRPIKGYAQLVKLFIYILGGVSIVAVLIGESPWGLLSGIGAMTAVVLLIFRDTILSLVASIQIAANDLLRKGDWIEMPSMNADGDVVEVALNAVMVQNWDLTITAVPTHKFLDTPFKNWRNMSQSGARRMQRSMKIDLSTVRFADEDLFERLKKVQKLADYIEERQAEIDKDNTENNADTSSPLNGRRMTNLGLFRRYALEYLKNRDDISKSRTLMVRQKAPDASEGLPLEIYCFITKTAWVEHENVQSDIMDHLLAAMPEFGLRAYQRNALVDCREHT